MFLIKIFEGNIKKNVILIIPKTRLMNQIREKKILIIRFSSFGDIIQCLSIVNGLKSKNQCFKIHWVLRSDMKELASLHPDIDKIWSLDRREGLKGLVRLAKVLALEKFDYIYDAHSNLRSSILVFLLRLLSFGFILYKRPKKRFLRFLLFTLRLDFLKNDRRGMLTYQRPLEDLKLGVFDSSKVHWRFSDEQMSKCRELIKNKFGEGIFITLAPSAAWEMKRWPIAHWKSLIELMPDKKFVVLGGPSDHFCTELEAVAPERVLNLAGKLSLLESCAIVKISPLVVVADTGILHVADLFGISAIGLIGPTAFGFTTGPTVKMMEVDLPCRPCTKDGRGKCSQKVWQRCMVEIEPEAVALEAHRLLAN